MIPANVRPATPAEIEEWEKLVEIRQGQREEIHSDRAVVFCHYMPDSPSYMGPVGLVLWGECCIMTQFTKNKHGFWEIGLQTSP